MLLLRELRFRLLVVLTDVSVVGAAPDGLDLDRGLDGDVGGGHGGVEGDGRLGVDPSLHLLEEQLSAALLNGHTKTPAGFEVKDRDINFDQSGKKIGKWNAHLFCFS